MRAMSGLEPPVTVMPLPSVPHNALLWMIPVLCSHPRPFGVALLGVALRGGPVGCGPSGWPCGVWPFGVALRGVALRGGPSGCGPSGWPCGVWPFGGGPAGCGPSGWPCGVWPCGVWPCGVWPCGVCVAHGWRFRRAVAYLLVARCCRRYARAWPVMQARLRVVAVWLAAICRATLVALAN